MKKFVAMMALGMLVTGAYAQDGTKKERKERTERSEGKRSGKHKAHKADPEERAAKHADRLSEKLNLSDAQKNELQALNMRKAQELKALNEKYDGSDARNESRRAERKAIQERWHADLKKVLDEKQYAAYEADRKEKRENFRKSGDERMKAHKKAKEARQKQNR